MTQFDVAEAANFFRNNGKADRKVMVLRRQICKYLLEHRLVVVNQLSLGATLERVAERIERGAPQEFHFCQQPKRRKDPGPEAHLARQAGGLVASRQQRRRQMKFITQLLAIELGPDLSFERAVGVEPSDL